MVALTAPNLCGGSDGGREGTGKWTRLGAMFFLTSVFLWDRLNTPLALSALFFLDEGGFLWTPTQVSALLTHRSEIRT